MRRVFRSTLILFALATASVAIWAAMRTRHQIPQAAASSAPSLVGEGWINVTPKELAKVKAFAGRVTVLHFWTFECINCKHNLPYYAKWAATYKSAEVQVIGIHTPELAAERDPRNVREAVKSLRISYPVLIDPEGTNWNRYHQDYWPTVYVIDKKGLVRYKWAGELQWDGQDGFRQVSAVIEKLRKE